MYNVIFIFLLYRHLVDKDRQQVNFLLPNIFRVVLRGGGGGINPPQRPPYVLERLETEEMKVGGGKWMGRGKRSCFFPLAVTYHVVTITITIGGERRWNHDVCSLISLLWLKPQLFGLSGRRVM